jgi:ABC-2 type transport system ATP-binding protein
VAACAEPVVAENLYKSYGGSCVLCGVSFSVKQGEVFAIVGPNGAGKTTLLETMLGLRRPDQGSVRLLCEKDASRALGRVGFFLEDMSLRPTLTLLENLELVAEIRGFKLSRRELVETLDMVGLRRLRDTLYGRLSAGQRKKANIAAALLGDPELLVLDEPEANLDPLSRAELMRLLSSLARERDLTVVYSTHVLSLVDKYSDRVLVLASGRVVALGEPRDVAASRAGGWRLVVRLRGGCRLLEDQGAERREDGAYVVRVPDAAAAARLLGLLASSCGGLEEAAMEPPRLEDVFDKLVAEGERA